MAKLTKEYRLIYSYDNIIQNAENYKDKVTGTMEFYDTFFQAAEFNSIGKMNKFIKDNKLKFKESETNEINPFDSEWNTDYPLAKVRMFIDSINAMKLSIEQPEFVMLLKQRNIRLIVDENYGGTWAYLGEIEKEHKEFIETQYNAKFQYR